MPPDDYLSLFGARVVFAVIRFVACVRERLIFRTQSGCWYILAIVGCVHLPLRYQVMIVNPHTGIEQRHHSATSQIAQEDIRSHYMLLLLVAIYPYVPYQLIIEWATNIILASH
jgi:hypothetical protein